MAAFPPEQLQGTKFGQPVGVFSTSGHVPNCNCGTGDFDCRGSTAGTYTIVIESSASMPRPDLPPATDFYWPPGIDGEPQRPRTPRRTSRWREWAHARRHARHDRAPPVMALE